MPRTKPVEIKPESAPSIGWDDVAGADEAKEELREVVEFLRDPKRFRKLGAKVPTRHPAARAARHRQDAAGQGRRHESGANFFAQSASSFVEMFAGLGAARIRRLFREARKNAPGDRLHRRARRRRRHARQRHLAARRTRRSTSCWSRWTASAARRTRRDRRLQPARQARPGAAAPGRFDRQIFVAPPDLDRARGDPQGALRATSRSQDVDLDAGRAPDQRSHRRRPGQHLQRGRDLRRPRPPRRDR